MSKVIDLSAFIQEGLQLVDPYDKSIIYNIPGEVPIKLYLKLLHFQQAFNNLSEDVQNIAKHEEFLQKAQELVADILALDKEKKINLEYVKNRFDFIMLRNIIAIMASHIQSILSNENFKSPELAEEKK